jgi:protein arginine kinase activator
MPSSGSAAAGERLCNLCRKHPIAIVVTDISKDGKSTELGLCSSCAQKKGLLDEGRPKLPVGEMLQSLKTRIQDSDRQMICPRCKLSYADFKLTLRLGCAECYTAFAERLNPTIRRIHGALRHTGRAPWGHEPDRVPAPNATREFEVRRLRTELRQAIEAEDYERAAAVRDRLRQQGGEESP